MIGSLFAKPLAVAAGVLGVAVLGLSVALYWSVSANGSLESRNTQLEQDLEQQQAELKQYAQLMQAQSDILAEHREQAQKLDEDLANANERLEQLKSENEQIAALADCRLPSDFVDWLQPDDNGSANGADRASGTPAARSTSAEDDGRANDAQSGQIHEATPRRRP